MDLLEALLDSWDRQCRIVLAMASRIDESNRLLKPSADGWQLDEQLAHIHRVRRYWLSQVSPEHGATMGEFAGEEWDSPAPDLETIRRDLEASGKAIRDAMREKLTDGTGAVGGYDHPVLFLQHMIWHEGWHVGLIFLGLRLGSKEPPEEWEEANVWGEWRTEEW